MKRAMMIAAVCTLSLPLSADESAKGSGVSPDAGEILRKMQAAMKAADTVGYHIDYSASGWVAAFVPPTTGEVVVGKQSKHEVDRFYCRIKIQVPQSNDQREMSAGSDGNEFFLIDPYARTAYQDMDPAVLGTNGRAITRVVLRELGMDEPFADIHKSGTVVVKGSREIGGEDCHELLFTGEDKREWTWCVSKKDLLPRLIERTFKNSDGEVGTTTMKLTNVRINPTFERDPFKLDLPPGYRKTDEFAP